MGKQTDKETNKQTQHCTDKPTRKTKQRQRVDGQIDRQTNKTIHAKHINGDAHKQTDKMNGIHTNRQTNNLKRAIRQSETQKGDKHTQRTNKRANTKTTTGKQS